MDYWNEPFTLPFAVAMWLKRAAPDYTIHHFHDRILLRLHHSVAALTVPNVFLTVAVGGDSLAAAVSSVIADNPINPIVSTTISLWEFDTHRWHPVSSRLPTNAHLYSVVVDPKTHRLHLTGGVILHTSRWPAPSNEAFTSREHWMYDLTTQQWRPQPDMPRGMSRHCSFIPRDGDQLFCIDGWAACGVAVCYLPTATWTTTLPQAVTNVSDGPWIPVHFTRGRTVMLLQGTWTAHAHAQWQARPSGGGKGSLAHLDYFQPLMYDSSTYQWTRIAFPHPPWDEPLDRCFCLAYYYDLEDITLYALLLDDQGTLRSAWLCSWEIGDKMPSWTGLTIV